MDIQIEGLTAFVLAGGAGTRLRPIVNDRPKALAEIDGRPFLYFQLEFLRRCGVSSVVLCTGYMADSIEQTIGSAHNGMPIRYSREESPLGTGGAIRHALPLADSERVLVVNGDTLIDAELQDFCDQSLQHSAAASLLLVRVDDVSGYGIVDVDDKGHIIHFREKADVGASDGWISAGIYLLTREFITAIPKDRPVSIEHEVFPAWTGERMFGYKATGSFIDIGTPQSYRLAEAFLKRLGKPQDV